MSHGADILARLFSHEFSRLITVNSFCVSPPALFFTVCHFLSPLRELKTRETDTPVSTAVDTIVAEANRTRDERSVRVDRTNTSVSHRRLICYRKTIGEWLLKWMFCHEEMQTPSSALISGAYVCTLFIFAKIAWVLSIAARFRGCSLVRWRASNDELRSLPTQRSGSLTPSPSYLAHTLSVAFANSPSPFISTFLSRARGALARCRALSSSFSFSPDDAAGGGATRRGFIRNLYPAARVRQRWRTTRASAKNVHTYWCYLRGGKSNPPRVQLPCRGGRSERVPGSTLP